MNVIPGEAERNVVSADDALESLIRVARGLEGPVTVQAYEANEGDGDVPAIIIQRRWGSWVNALAKAGLQERMSAKARHKWLSGDYLRMDTEAAEDS